MTESIGVHKMTKYGRVFDQDLSETERAELEQLRRDNVTLRMEWDFAKKVADWFAKEQP